MGRKVKTPNALSTRRMKSISTLLFVLCISFCSGSEDPWYLIEAIESDQKDRIHDLFKKGALNWKDSSFRENTALHLAARDNKSKVVKILIENGADTSAENYFGETALNLTTATDLIEAIITDLIEKGALNLNWKDDDGNMALHMVAIENTQNSAKYTKILIKKGADVHAKNKYGETALHMAAYSNSPDIAKILIENGADKDAKDDDGETVLQIATRLNNTDVKTVIEKTENLEPKRIKEKDMKLKGEADQNKKSLDAAEKNLSEEKLKIDLELKTLKEENLMLKNEMRKAEERQENIDLWM